MRTGANSFRIPFHESVFLTDLELGNTITGEATDLSSGGMFIQTTDLPENGASFHLRFPWPNGDWFETNATVVRTVPDRGFGLSFSETTVAEPNQVDTFIREQTHVGEARKLLEISQQVNAGTELHQILDYVYTSFREIIPYDRIGLSLLTRGGKRAKAIWTRSELPSGNLPDGYAADMKNTSLDVVSRVNEPRILNDLEEYLRAHPKSDSTQRMLADGMRSSLTCPLMAEGRAIGFLFFSSAKPNMYSARHVQTFLDLAQQISLAVERGVLFDDVVRTKKKLERTNRKLQRLSHIDRLTTLRNRRYFDQRLSDEWKRAKRSGRPLSLIMVDVDYFKPYNDKHGHPAGDRCLASIAKALQRALRRPDEFVARYGGEEFAVLLPETEPSGAIQTAGLLRRAIAGLRIPHGASTVDPMVTISLGAASLSQTACKSPLELLQGADRELYRAKSAGRNRACFSL